MPILKRINIPAPKPGTVSTAKRVMGPQEQKEADELTRNRRIAMLEPSLYTKTMIETIRTDVPAYATDPRLPETYRAYRGDMKGTITNQATAIEAFCAGCQVATSFEDAEERVAACDDVDCPLWVFRLGSNPLGR